MLFRDPIVSSIVVVGLGAGVGGIMRFGLQSWLAHESLPWGTLTANLLGCLLAGFLFATVPTSPTWLRLFLLTGWMGALTTMSGFALEILTLVQAGRMGLALGYAIGVATSALVLAAVGLQMGQWMIGSSS